MGSKTASHGTIVDKESTPATHEPFPTRYLVVDPATQTIAAHFAVVDGVFLKSVIGCQSLETRSVRGRHILWFNETVVPRGVLVDVFVLDGIDLAGSVAVITGPQIDEVQVANCDLEVAVLLAAVRWAPQRKVTGERLVETCVGMEVEWVYEPPL